ncbi:MAG TPA: TIGR02147 family protein [Fibrobacteria bacterium]|nr:TIGR02147 family protein [Fibrobacteria bacterium]
MKPMPPIVTDYLDFRSFLKEWFRYRKEVQPGYSMRTFASNPALGISSTSYMTNLLKGTRNLTQRQRLQFGKALKLEGPAAEYFDFLVQFNQAKTLDEKNYFFAHLSKHRGSQAKVLLEKQYAFFAKWHHSVIYNYLGLEKAEGVPARIAKHLAEELSAQEVQESLDLLLAMGLIRKTANGFGVTDRHLMSRKVFTGQVAKDYHREFLRLASGALDKYGPDKRQFNVLAFSVSDKGFAAVKQRIDAFLQEVREIVDRDDGINQVNVLNVQLFPGARIP